MKSMYVTLWLYWLEKYLKCKMQNIIESKISQNKNNLTSSVNS